MARPSDRKAAADGHKVNVCLSSRPPFIFPSSLSRSHYLIFFLLVLDIHNRDVLPTHVLGVEVVGLERVAGRSPKAPHPGALRQGRLEAHVRRPSGGGRPMR